MISNELVILGSDLSGFCEPTSTSSNSTSELPTTLGMLRYVFDTCSARSRDSRGPYTARIASRDRKTSAKVVCLTVLATHRRVRPYHWPPHIDSMACMRASQQKIHCEIAPEHVSDAVGCIKHSGHLAPRDRWLHGFGNFC